MNFSVLTIYPFKLVILLKVKSLNVRSNPSRKSLHLYSTQFRINPHNFYLLLYRGNQFFRMYLITPIWKTRGIFSLDLMTVSPLLLKMYFIVNPKSPQKLFLTNRKNVNSLLNIVYRIFCLTFKMYFTPQKCGSRPN